MKPPVLPAMRARTLLRAAPLLLATACQGLWLPGHRNVARGRPGAVSTLRATVLDTRVALGVPTLDLAGDPRLPIEVDRDPNQYLGHPTTVLLEDGHTMLVVYPRGHGEGAIQLKRSTDAGVTWGSRLPVPENWATSKETPTIHRVVDRDGRRRLILFSGLYPIRMAVSEDDGRRWSPLAPIGDFGGIVAMASVERLRSGDYLAFFHDDGRFFANSGKRSAFTVYTTRSRDGGLHWERPVAIASRSDMDLCEPGVFRSPDGRRLVVLLRENRRAQPAQVITSDNEGATWSRPRPLQTALTGDRHVATYLPDGRLFVTFRDMAPNSPTKGDWVAWLGTYDDLLKPTPSGYRVRLMDNVDSWDAAYPGLVRLPDGMLVTTTYGHWTAGAPPWIATLRLDYLALDRALRSGLPR